MQIYRITIIVHVKCKSDISLKMRWICSPNANLLYIYICFSVIANLKLQVYRTIILVYLTVLKVSPPPYNLKNYCKNL